MAHVVVVHTRTVRTPVAGDHCVWGLEEAGHDVHHFDPLRRDGSNFVFRGYDELPWGADLYLQVDDDIAYPPLAGHAPRTAYWCIDTHRMDLMAFGGTRWERINAGFDHVFSAQRDRAVELDVPWLPLAADTPDPTYWQRLASLGKQYPWCFVGTMFDERRKLAEFLHRIAPDGFAGTATGEEHDRIYAQSHVALNLTIGNDVNMRFFEVQATGTPLLSNRVHNGEDELFDHVLYYESAEQLASMLRELLSDPDELAGIGSRQRDQVLSHHTYARRMDQLLAHCGID